MSLVLPGLEYQLWRIVQMAAVHTQIAKLLYLDMVDVISNLQLIVVHWLPQALILAQ